jgi:hypothetical protein
MMSLGTEIPTFLIGKATPVRRRMRAAFKRVFKQGGWSQVIAGLDYIDIDDAPGWIQIHGPMNLLEGENVVVWLTMEEMWHSQPPEPDRTYEELKHILIEGLDYFWFALCILSVGLFLPFDEKREAEAPFVARKALPKLLRWWDEFCRLEPRFSWGLPQTAPWPTWGTLALCFCRDIGASDDDLAFLQSLDAVEAGEQMRVWLRDRE